MTPFDFKTLNDMHLREVLTKVLSDPTNEVSHPLARDYAILLFQQSLRMKEYLYFAFLDIPNGEALNLGKEFVIQQFVRSYVDRTAAEEWGLRILAACLYHQGYTLFLENNAVGENPDLLLYPLIVVKRRFQASST